MTAGDDIWEAIRASNAAWTSGNPRAVGALFADDVVMVAPGLAGRVEGREANYCRDVRAHAFREIDHAVDVRGDTAVAVYRFEVRYEMGGATHEESGQEILVFARREGRWQAIWRTQIPLPAQQE